MFKMKILRLFCSLLSRIHHFAKKKKFFVVAGISEKKIETLVEKHNNLVDELRKNTKSSQEAIAKFPYITSWGYLWELEKGVYHGKIQVDTTMENF